MKRLLSLSALALSLSSTIAFAGPVQDFETALRGSYGNYRMALFATNSGDAAKSAKAMAGFADSWAALTASYGTTPPPQYETDAGFAATFAAVQAQIDAAKADIDAGALPKAHEALEGVRGQIGALHERNNIVSFSDRMNAYHAAMEEVLGLDLAAADAATLAEHAGVMGYLAAEIVRLPAPEAADNADYAKLQEAFTASVMAFDAAVKAGDAAAIKAAVAGLKVPYSKFFLMFG